ncbi:MAG: transcription termination/antitermination NusG family protein [Bryobacterales bacterium]|nr:transcription termination/antitermination NusG family protein [Bryobacterales bacterium]
MIQTPSRAEWYALAVKPRHERTAARNLHCKGLEEFSPVYRARRRWCDRIKELETPLFPGYVFCRFSFEQRMQVLNTPGVASIVGFGKAPAPLAEEEIAAVQAIVASGFAASPWPYLRVGQKVRIEQGCLEGVVGILLREKGLCRVLVNVEILQRAVAVEIDRGILCPVREAA